jgi:hypothetical protein
MEQILSKKEKEKLMDNYATEKTEDNNISIDLENKIIKKTTKKKPKKHEEEKNPLYSTITDNQFTSENKTSLKSTNSFEKQDMSEDMIMTISSNKKYHTKNKNSVLANQSFTKHYETMIEYEKKRLEKIMRLREHLKNVEIKKLKSKPEISKKSKELINNMKNNKENIIQRMKEEEKKAKQKRKYLAEKIKEERKKRKELQEKKPEYKIKKIKPDKKFNKFYTKMLENDKMKKQKFAKFTEVVKDYEMRECVFQPNLTEFDENRYKNLNSNKLVQRLYEEEIKKREQKKLDLEKKYKPSFKPEINNTSIELAKRFKNKERNSVKSRNVKNIVDKRLNNSVQKRISRNYNLKETEKVEKFNVTEDNKNKTIDNDLVEDFKNEIINNIKLNKNDKNKNKSDKSDKEEQENKEEKTEDKKEEKKDDTKKENDR